MTRSAKIAMQKYGSVVGDPRARSRGSRSNTALIASVSILRAAVDAIALALRLK